MIWRPVPIFPSGFDDLSRSSLRDLMTCPDLLFGIWRLAHWWRGSAAAQRGWTRIWKWRNDVVDLKIWKLADLPRFFLRDLIIWYLLASHECTNEVMPRMHEWKSAIIRVPPPRIRVIRALIITNKNPRKSVLRSICQIRVPKTTNEWNEWRQY